MENTEKMMRKYDIKFTLFMILVYLLGLVGLAFVGLEIYVWIKYGNMPYDQIPAWVWWFMIGKR